MSKKVLLYSGGTDSWIIDKIWKPDVCLYVGLGSMYSNAELSRLSKPACGQVIATHLPLGDFEDKKTAFIPMRNMYLLMQACYFGDTICLGATAEDAGGSSDKDIDFLNEAEHLLNRLWKPQSLFKGKKITIEKRFTQYTKEQLLQEYLNQGGDIETFKKETFSCYTPTYDDKECFYCKCCFRKFIVCYGNGALYSDEALRTMQRFIEENVVHRSHHAEGRYFLDKENGQQTLKVIKKLYDHLGLELNLD